MTRTKGHDRVELYQAPDGWRWRYRRSNGRVMADSGEAYVRRANGRVAAERLFGASRLAWSEVGLDGSEYAVGTMIARVLADAV